ncbi:hypothetical protein [Cryptosporangium sp. NPDC051539]|uniref:hypothetical protein n=1 Tax=Cryptosporangium sp. NPDC051539 TaxID=3363962 RepID=UPI0037B0055E
MYVQVADPAAKARLAATIARVWAYSSQPSRAAGFADQAVALARTSSDPAVLADCLDAALTAHWGPDDLPRRREWAAELDETAAHLLDPRPRQQAHLWGVTVAFETLDLPAIHRQLRALERLGEHSAEARFFGASRRLAVDLMRGRYDTAPYLREVARVAAAETFIADGEAVRHAMTAYPALMTGDQKTCADEAVVYEEFGLAEGSPTVLAEGAWAWVWVGAGQLDRAAALVGHLGPVTLTGLPRDADWLLTLQCTLEAAIATRTLDVIDVAVDLLAAYESRAVVNAGAVMFHGVTDDTLARGHAILGHDAVAERLRDQALATYRRIGATWWRERLEGWSVPVAAPGASFVLRPLAGGLWQLGSGAESSMVPGVKGFEYLHRLLSAPGTDISALDLTGAGAVQPEAGNILDERAIAAYRRRLAELEGGAGSGAEQDALRAQLNAAIGLGGRRRGTGSTAERARVAVRKAIVAALLRVAEADPALGRYLYEHIRTGSVCRYDPSAPVRWDLGNDQS